MKAGGDSQGYRVMAEINMVPLIDITLVLLIIFMIMTPILVKSQLKINLPQARTAEATPREKVVDVQIDEQGGTVIGGNLVAADGVEGALRAIIRDPENQPVFIQADRSTDFGNVVRVIDAAKSLGVSKVGVGARTETAPVRPRR